jgi:hypothetical protein
VSDTPDLVELPRAVVDTLTLPDGWSGSRELMWDRAAYARSYAARALLALDRRDAAPIVAALAEDLRQLATRLLAYVPRQEAP